MIQGIMKDAEEAGVANPENAPIIVVLGIIGVVLVIGLVVWCIVWNIVTPPPPIIPTLIP